MALNQSEVDKFVKKIYNLYATAFKEAVRIGYVEDHDTERIFSFKDYPEVNKKVNKLLADLSTQVVKIIDSGTEAAWIMADQQNDTLVKKLFGKNPPEAVKERYLGRNIEALRSFQSRKDAGLNLSKRIWSHTKTLGGEIEAAIDLGLLDGRPASELAQDIKQYLIEPDKLFRRVRGADGILRLSKAAKAYHPGQGIYRSSYKNAERVTRTEINMAYRASDHERWKSLDFVVGFEVKRSNHPFGCLRCEALKGKYPKTFKFSGWHPQCRCYAVSILAADSEIDELERMLLNDEDASGFKSKNEITEPHTGYVNYVANNRDRLSGRSQPYFVRDNFESGVIPLSFGTKTPVSADPVFTPAGVVDHEKKYGVKIDRGIFGLLSKEVPLKTIPGKSHFDPRDGTVSIGSYERFKKSDWFAESIYYHEYGHAVDTGIGLRSNKAVSDLMNKHKKLLSKKDTDGISAFYKLDKQLNLQNYEYQVVNPSRNNTEQLGALADTIMSLNKNYGWGHTKKYFSLPLKSEAEFTAHAFENKFIGNEIFKAAAPDLYADMVQLIDDLIAGKIK